VRAAAAQHAFAGIADTGAPAILHTTGNPDCHIILRGGHGMPNYHVPEVEDALVTLGVAGLPERLVIDASHDNSGKEPEKQFFAAGEIADQVADGNKAITGVMLESFLVEGAQKLSDAVDGQLVYGQSITDACLGWEDTVQALDRFASAVQARDRKSTRLHSSHTVISYAVFCLEKKRTTPRAPCSTSSRSPIVLPWRSTSAY